MDWISTPNERFSTDLKTGWLFDTRFFPPRWECGTWTAFEGWLQIASDALIFFSYMAIPFIMVLFMQRRKDIAMRWIAYLFVVFIVSCGFTHLLSAIIFWWPAYNFLGVVKAITALASLGTVVVLIFMLPKAIKLPSIQMLEAEVSARKATEQQLAISEKQYRSLVEANTTFIFITGPEGQFKKPNPKWEAYTGKDWESTQDYNWRESLQLPEEVDAEQFLHSQTSRARPKTIECRLWNAKSQSMHHVELAAVPLFDKESNVESWVCSVADLEEEFQIEAKADLLARHLTLTRRHYQHLVEATTDIVWSTDAKGHFLENQPSWGAYTGQTFEEMKGFGWANVIHPDDREALLQDWGLALTEQDLYKSSGRIYQASTKEWRHFFVRAYPILSPDGQVEEWFGAVIDVEEPYRLQNEKQLLLSNLKMKNEELEKVIYVASHDLRSPLVNIQGFSNELKSLLDELYEDIYASVDEPPHYVVESREMLSQCLDYILSSASRMNALLNGFLKYSRMGRVSIQPNPIDMNLVVEEAMLSFAFLIKQEGITVSVNDLPSCFGDKNLLIQVFSNLIDNSIKYRSPGRSLEIEISGGENDAYYLYTIKDNGIGIKESHQSKVFEIFHRLNPDSTQGEGLGLALVTLIVQRHGGIINLESSEDKGCEFTVLLPKSPTHTQVINT